MLRISVVDHAAFAVRVLKEGASFSEDADVIRLSIEVVNSLPIVRHI
jgi:hypothetical protein